MTRIPLRSKTGCDRCRYHRVKCGEEKPVCARCSKYNRICIWTAATRDRQTTRDALVLPHTTQREQSALVCYQNGFLTAGYQTMRDETQLPLIQNAVRFITKFISFGAEVDSIGRDFGISLAFNTPWTRAVLSAFPTAAMSRLDRRFSGEAAAYYNAAIRHTRIYLTEFPQTHADVYLLTSALFLGLMQYFGSGSPRAAFTHLAIVARQGVDLRTLHSSDITVAHDQWLLMLVCLALDLAGNLYVFEPRISLLFEGQWQVLETFFCNNVYRLTLLGIGLKEQCMRTDVQLRMNRLLYISATPSEVQDVLQRISVLENYGVQLHSTPHQTQSSTNLIHGWFAETYMFRIHVAAVANPGACSGNPLVRRLVDEWQYHLQEYVKTRADHLPYAVLLLPFTNLTMDIHLAVVGFYFTLMCAMFELDSFKLLAGWYESLQLVLDEHLTDKMKQLILLIEYRKRTNTCELNEKGICGVQHDGLDVLRDPAAYFWSK